LASRALFKFKVGTMPGVMYQVRKQSMNQLRIGGRVFIREPMDGSKWEQVVIDRIVNEDIKGSGPNERPELNIYFAYRL